jgi:hypothetical protein
LRFAGEAALGRVDLVRDAVERRAHHRDPAPRREALVRVEQEKVVDARDLGQARVLLACVLMHADAADHRTDRCCDDAGHDRPGSIERDPSQEDVGDEPEPRRLGITPQTSGKHGKW